MLPHQMTRCLCDACRYCYPADLSSRLSCALLAAELLPAVFATDIIHPQRRVDFAAYTPVQIWPGVDVFEDKYRQAQCC